jgi:ubiquinone/menaquinone biosynthesis C-methylase UbiE
MAAPGPAGAPVAGNVYDKYGTSNPVARLLMAGFLSTVGRFVGRTRPRRLLEVGCGEGHLLGHVLGRCAPEVVVGVDLSADVVRQARARYGQRAAFQVASADALPFADRSFDLVLACEVLEHVPDPARAIDELARVTAGELIVTVPREPLWRALNVLRGKYLADLGNTPGHVQHFSRRAIRALVARRFEVLEVATPIPWTAIRARAR